LVFGNLRIESDAVDAFADIITEAIRHGSSAIEFTYVLQDAGVDASTVRHAQDQYTAQQTSLAAQMSRMRIRSSACPVLQTMNWRLDWIVKGSSAERSTHPMYTLSFQGKDGSEFTVQATREELVDLSSKCKEALRSAERHVK
jgi:hypothetical protein